MSNDGTFPPPGWTVDRGHIEEVTTVFGYMRRHVEMIGVCQTQECRRRCYLEYPRLIRQGLADVQMRLVTQTLHCNRLGGCSLQFRERRSQAITLRQLAHRPNVAARVRCMLCSWGTVTSVPALIRQLESAGKGDASTSIAEVHSLISGACPGCKRPGRWTVEFLWHDPADKPPSWRTDLEQRMADAQRRRDLDRGLVA